MQEKDEEQQKTLWAEEKPKNERRKSRKHEKSDTEQFQRTRVGSMMQYNNDSINRDSHADNFRKCRLGTAQQIQRCQRMKQDRVKIQRARCSIPNVPVALDS